MDGEQIVRDVAERIRGLVAEAEDRAAEIVRAAEADAQHIRERAEAEARERLAEVRSALDELQGRLGAAEVEPGPATVPEPEPPAVPEPTPDPVPDPMPSPEPVPEPTPEPMPEPTPPPDEGTPQAANGSPSDDEAAARLVVMNLALDGASRDEAKAQLGAEYDVPDLDGLVDEVYSRAGK